MELFILLYYMFGGMQRITLKQPSRNPIVRSKRTISEIYVKSYCNGDIHTQLISDLKKKGKLPQNYAINDKLCNEPSDSVLNEHDSIAYISKGGYNAAYKITKSGKNQVLRLSLENVDNFQINSELEGLFMQASMAKLHKDGICNVYDFGQYFLEENGKVCGVYAVLEYMPRSFCGCEVTLTENDKISQFNQLLKTLEIMHQQRYVHLDLKPDNVLVASDNKVKLIDFGSTMHIPESKLCIFQREIMCSDYYVDPCALFSGLVCFDSDLYAVGAMLCKIICHHDPFRELDGFNPDNNIYPYLATSMNLYRFVKTYDSGKNPEVIQAVKTFIGLNNSGLYKKEDEAPITKYQYFIKKVKHHETLATQIVSKKQPTAFGAFMQYMFRTNNTQKTDKLPFFNWVMNLFKDVENTVIAYSDKIDYKIRIPTRETVVDNTVNQTCVIPQPVPTSLVARSALENELKMVETLAAESPQSKSQSIAVESPQTSGGNAQRFSRSTRKIRPTSMRKIKTKRIKRRKTRTRTASAKR